MPPRAAVPRAGAALLLLALALTPAASARTREELEATMRMPLIVEYDRTLEDPAVLYEWYRGYISRGGDRVLYNRIPKTGSGSMLNFLGDGFDGTPALSGLSFEHLPQGAWSPSAKGTKTWVDWYRAHVDAGDAQIYGEGHGTFVDLPRWGLPPAVWFTVFRNPAERVVSQFYYGLHDKAMVAFQRQVCGLPDSGPVPRMYECTQELQCFACSTWISDIVPRYLVPINEPEHANKALEEADFAEARRIVRDEYLLVMPLEDIQHGWQLLECLMPGDTFAGIAQKWAESNPVMNVNAVKPRALAEDGAVATRIARLMGEEGVYHEAMRRFCGLWAMAERYLSCPSLQGWSAPEGTCGPYAAREPGGAGRPRRRLRRGA